MRRSRILKKAVYGAAVFLCIFCTGIQSASSGYQAAGLMDGSVRITADDTVSKILTLLEFKNSNQRILDKAAGKLHAMNERELRLMSSLCDRISVRSNSAGADIAFSLITAMIVLS
jgi:hypothetical protein